MGLAQAGVFHKLPAFRHRQVMAQGKSRGLVVFGEHGAQGARVLFVRAQAPQGPAKRVTRIAARSRLVNALLGVVVQVGLHDSREISLWLIGPWRQWLAS